MKYIYVAGIGIVMFPATCNHDDIANLFNGIAIESAGFVRCDDPDVLTCSGDSMTLKLKSRVVDTGVLRSCIR